MNRRQVIALIGGSTVLAGCSDRQDPTKDQPSKTESEPTETGTPTARDYSYQDLKIVNQTDTEVVVTVTFVPEGNSAPKLTVTKALSAGNTYVWDDISPLDESGHVTVEVEDDSGDSRQKEHEWPGDTVDDNHGLEIYVDEDELRVRTVVV